MNAMAATSHFVERWFPTVSPLVEPEDRGSWPGGCISCIGDARRRRIQVTVFSRFDATPPGDAGTLGAGGTGPGTRQGRGGSFGAQSTGSFIFRRSAWKRGSPRIFFRKISDLTSPRPTRWE
jgi:hypothetical protein